MKYREILEAAIRAPSGDNCQPWRVELRGDTIHLFNVPERDTSLYNYRQRASLVAHGAFLENLSIAASAKGYSAEITPFPDSDREDLIASILLGPGTAKDEPLYPHIFQRTINRRLYKGGALSAMEQKALLDGTSAFHGGRLVLLNDTVKISDIAGVLALNDRLVFENRNLHRFLFEHLRWSHEEALMECDGLDLATLELSPLDETAFRIFKHWPVVRLFNQCGLSLIIAGKGRKLAESAACVGVITAHGSSPLEYLNGGRMLERVWLEATRLGLSFHPMTGITFLMQRVLDGAAGEISENHITLVKNALGKVRNICGISTDTALLLFRIGRSKDPSARSARLPVERVLMV